MSEGTKCISEIIRYGEQLCLLRDVYEKANPDCGNCPLVKFCEKERTDEEIVDLVVELGKGVYRREYFGQMEEAEYDE